MPHRHDDKYVHRHDFGADSHIHRLIEVVEHAHGAHGDKGHSHTHIVMTDRSERTNGGSDHRHRLKEPFEHDHPSEPQPHRHRLGDLEHEVADRHWHPVEITEIELTIEPPGTGPQPRQRR
ncbi:MAG TPA: hypothetical protein VGR77_07395 [Candidatus Dormibacteraeota bacterium]|nr:hypothetical protein [Candidatus Dormibacteraeota bacterium]